MGFTEEDAKALDELARMGHRWPIREAITEKAPPFTLTGVRDVAARALPEKR